MMFQLKKNARFAMFCGASAIALAGSAQATTFGSEALANVIDKTMPAVVFIEVTAKPVATASKQTIPEDPRFEEFMKRFGNQFEIPDQRSPQQGVGSGFIISEDGLIVTNNHVIENAESVVVTLEDGSEHEAIIVGSDQLTDIALLDIEGNEFPTVGFGLSDDMRVGEGVFAIGSPFGLGGTVTTGIVSAKSRDINSGPFDDFIQTDAAVNRGNSGGPLFNLEGEVIGMNTAIYSPGGGSVGIGFAVPSDLVQDIVADLQDDGKIDRAWLGVQLKAIPAEVAQVLGFKDGAGAMVQDVLKDTPAETAGLQDGDIVLKFSDKMVGDVQDLMRLVATAEAGKETPMVVFRGGEEVNLLVTLAMRQEHDA